MSVATASYITAAFTLMLLAGCGDGTRGSEYFPLMPGAEWQYRVQRVTMDGASQLRYLIRVGVPMPNEPTDQRTRVTFDGQRLIYKLKDEGIYRIDMQRAPGPAPTQNVQQQMVMPANLSLKQQWQDLSVTAVLETKRPPFESMFRLQAPIEMHYRIASLHADVTTPAGVFNNCLLINGSGSAESDLGNGIGHATIEVTNTEWYAPNVGLVRMERHERTSAPALKSGTVVMELDKWSPP
jgi:hypothetical protein